MLEVDKELLEQAEQAYRATMTDENRQIRDDVITPFGMAMKVSGYTPILLKGGCVDLRECPLCKGKHSTLYQKGEVRFWACPYCKKITSD